MKRDQGHCRAFGKAWDRPAQEGIMRLVVWNLIQHDGVRGGGEWAGRQGNHRSQPSEERLGVAPYRQASVVCALDLVRKKKEREKEKLALSPVIEL